MNFFVTAETTADVTQAEFSVLLDLEDWLNRTAFELTIDGVEHIGIVLVIMNPEVAPPFPTGVVFRRARKELDIKPAIDFGAWKAADRQGRVGLVAKAVSVALTAHPKKALSGHSIASLEAALERGNRDFQLG